MVRAGLAPDDVPPSEAWRDLLERVSRSYADVDQERYTLERAMQISGSEMQALHEELRASFDAQEKDAGKLRAVIQAIGDGLCVMDDVGRVVFVNPVGAAMLGKPEGEVVGQRILDLLQFERDEGAGSRTDRLYERLRTVGAVRGDDARLCRGPDQELAVSFVLNPMHDRERVTGAVLVFRDRTSEVRAREQLVAAQGRAEAASRAKSNFLATMSHEIRTPMNAVLGMMHQLLESRLDPLQRELAETAVTSGNTLLTLIGDILDYSKIEAGKLDLESIEFDLDQAIDDVVDLFADSAAAKGLVFDCVIDPAVPGRVRGDPGRLRQVLTNYLSNAVKFTQSGSVTVHVCVDPTAAGALRIAVTDTGPGIAPEKQRLLFRAFSQADASTTREFGGTGLGLAISRSLVEAMGGKVGVESEPGRGSTFWCTVPDTSLPDGATPMAGLHVVLLTNGSAADATLCSRLERFGARVVVVSEPTVVVDRLNGLPPGQRLVVTGAEAACQTLLDRLAADPALGDVRTIVTGRSRRTARPAVLCHPRTACFARLPIHGARFVEQLARSAQRDPDAARAAEVAVVPPPQTLRVLLVEDNLINQTVARRMLEHLGHRVHIAANGIEALAAINASSFDVVLMDCQMPQMDGYEATRRIRASEAGDRRIPIIALTANAMKGDREACLASGMDDFLTKPVRPADLATAIGRWTPR